MRIMYTNPNTNELELKCGQNRFSEVGEKYYAFREFLGATKNQILEHFNNEVIKAQTANEDDEAERRQVRLYRLTNELSDPVDHELLWEIMVETDVPVHAISPRKIDSNQDLDSIREFREAWCDVTPESIVDVNLSKAKEIQLGKLRSERQKAFVDLGFPYKLNPEVEEAIVSPETKAKLKSLRDATEPLKALIAEGYNDEDVLEQIRQLGKLNVY